MRGPTPRKAAGALAMNLLKKRAKVLLLVNTNRCDNSVLFRGIGFVEFLVPGLGFSVGHCV